MNSTFRAWIWAALFLPAATMGCKDRGGESSARVDEISGRLDRVEQEIVGLGEAVRSLEGLVNRVTEVEGTVRRLEEAQLEIYQEHSQQIALLREQVNERLDRMATESERRRIGELARDPEGLEKALEAGGVHLDRKARQIRVKGSVCQTRAVLEYLAVGPGGKDHESLFFIDCVPSLLNAAFIALGLDGGTPARVEDRSPEAGPGGIPVGGDEQQDLLYFAPQGPRVWIHVEWDHEGSRQRVRADDLVINRITGKSIEPVGWVYLGSRFAVDPSTGLEEYVADVTRDLISLWHSYRGNAIVDNPRPEGRDDDVYIANAKRLPEPGTPVEFLFTLEPLDPQEE